MQGEIGSKDRKNSTVRDGLKSNLISLAFIQVANYIFPLLVVLVLTSSLGLEKYGLLVYAQSIVFLLGLVVDFGFDLSTTRGVAKSRGKTIVVSGYFCGTIMVKLSILGGVVLGVLAFQSLLSSEEGFETLLYCCLLALVGQVLTPTWLFQGKEKVKYLALIQVVLRTATLLMILVLVEKESDFITAALLMSLGSVISGLLAFLIAIRMFSISYVWLGRKRIKKMMVESAQFFLSKVSTQGGYHLMNLLVGYSLGVSQVGVFDLICKVYRAYIGVYGIVAQALYPYIVRTQNLKVLIFGLKVSMVVGLLVYVLFEYAAIVGSSYLAPDMAAIVMPMVRVLMVASLFAIPSALIGYPWLAAFGHVEAASFSVVVASLAQVLFMISTFLLDGGLYLYALSIAGFEIFALSIRVFFLFNKKMVTREIWNSARI